jgi:putative methyltransferase (TIGR04325 family)
VEKVRRAAIKVKNGGAVFERDSVVFGQVDYSFPVLAALLCSAVESQNRLSVLDFGGSLGSHYYQNRAFLSGVKAIEWSVVEQTAFVESGRNQFQDEILKFYFNVDECLRERNPGVLLLSSVLPYLPDPRGFLASVLRKGFPMIVVDRTPLIPGSRDRLTVQRVPPSVYPASYPAWFFSRDRFLDEFRAGYELCAEFDALAGRIPLSGGVTAVDKGFIFRRKIA